MSGEENPVLGCWLINPLTDPVTGRSSRRAKPEAQVYTIGPSRTQYIPLVGKSAGLACPLAETLIHGILFNLDHDPSHPFRVSTLLADMISGKARERRSIHQ